MQRQEYQEVMKRKIYNQLLRWKSDDNGQNALLIDGGTTYYLSTPYVIHTSDLAEKDGIVYLPLYMTPLL